MGVYSDYLNQNMNFATLNDERKKWLSKISSLRGNRGILVYASDINKQGGNSSIDYSDLLPFTDQLESIKDCENVDILLQTPGGQAEIVESMVKALRRSFNKIGIIVPGIAMSAGTIFAMAGDEILMGKESSLGPIDAQIIIGGKRFSADAYLDGLDKIKQEVIKANNQLNPAYIPILQSISPGEIQTCENAQLFSSTLVRNWLKQYKFSSWDKHASSGKKVTTEEKEKRAKEIADALCKHSKWLTHSRSIGITELRELKLEILDYSEKTELSEAINHYFTLLMLTFDSTNIFKIFETPTSQLFRHVINNETQKTNIPVNNEIAEIELTCPRCNTITKVQANLNVRVPLKEGFILFPEDNIFKCPKCGLEMNLLGMRLQIESQSKKRII